MAVTTSNFQQVAGKIADLSRIHAPLVSITVGFSAPYAARVHEDISMPHNNGEAKFLENAIRSVMPNADQIIAGQIQMGKTMREAIRYLAEDVKYKAQSRCPVDTGFLQDSAFIRVRDA